MTPTEILIAARAKIDTPEKWTQRAVARNAAGNRVGVMSKAAECFCVVGALEKVAFETAPEYSVYNCFYSSYISSQFIETVLRLPLRIPLYKWNDDPSTTHADVMNAFDRAIELARNEP